VREKEEREDRKKKREKREKTKSNHLSSFFSNFPVNDGDVLGSGNWGVEECGEGADGDGNEGGMKEEGMKERTWGNVVSIRGN
jgi:hypothetical protein